MENIIDRFIETMKNASQSEVNNLLNNSKNELSKDGYIFFKNLIFHIRKEDLKVISRE